MIRKIKKIIHELFFSENIEAKRIEELKAENLKDFYHMNLFL